MGAVVVCNGVKQNQSKFDCPFIDLFVGLSFYMVFTYFHSNSIVASKLTPVASNDVLYR